MNLLPYAASDELLIKFVDQWVRFMEAEDYEAAFAHTAHSPHMQWSPQLLREVIKSYNKCLPTQRVTLDGRATDVQQRKDVNRYPETRHGCIGYIWYDLNIDGLVSDITATFDIRSEDEGLAIVLDDIHVM